MAFTVTTFSKPKRLKPMSERNPAWIKHGQARKGKVTPEYQIWAKMISRCHAPGSSGYDAYGKRGIVVCNRWRHSFTDFFADMGPRPSPEYSIDRIDVNGNYEPDNCRWADAETQANNTHQCRYLTFGGETLTITQWTRRRGWKPRVIFDRLLWGWTVEESLTTPVGTRRNKCAAEIQAKDAETANPKYQEFLVIL